MRESVKNLAGTAFLVLLAAGSALAWGQRDKRDQHGATTLQVYSQLTVVDVTATDAQGQPVHGLKQSDFTILEDGKPQFIRNFEEVSAEPQTPSRQLPPDVYTNLQPPPPSSAVNILLLDFANEAPGDSTNLKQLSNSIFVQQQVKQASIEAIDRMPPGTRMAVVSMTNSLRILQGFTSDKAILKAAIAATPYDLEGHGNSQEVQADMRNRMVLEMFDQIAADVAPMKGRKNLIWFSMGIPAITDPNHGPSLPDYSKPLSLAYDLLTSAQVSVYPVDARGVGTLGEAQLSLQMVAEATGGVAYSGTNDMATSVVKAVDNGANYYSIAYAPPDGKFNGAYHKIDVKVDRPGVHLVFRKGYYADDLSKTAAKSGLSLMAAPPPAEHGSMKAPMSRGFPASQQILFDVGVLPNTAPPKPGGPPVIGTLDPKLRGKHLTRYGFQYIVPSEQIEFNNGPKHTHKGALEFDIAVYDSNDKLLTGLSQTLTMPLSDNTYRQLQQNQGPVRFFQQIDLPPGQLFVRVGVRDVNSNKVGTLELPLTVGAHHPPKPTAGGD